MAYMGFKALRSTLAGRKGVRSPGGLARWIGDRKYGAARMRKAAATGTSLRSVAAKKGWAKRRSR